MGFGLLFFGYFSAFLMSINKYGFLFSIVGCYVMFVAIQKISDYKHSLMRAVFPLLAIGLCSLCEALRFFLEADWGMWASIITVIMSISRTLFHCFMFISISALGKDTELPDVTALAKTNLIFIVSYFAVEMTSVLLALFGISNQYLAITMAMMRLLFPVFALVLIFKCFHKICAPEDIDAPQKPSRFAFVNELRRRREERDEELKKMKEERNASKSRSGKTQNKKR